MQDKDTKRSGTADGIILYNSCQSNLSSPMSCIFSTLSCIFPTLSFIFSTLSKTNYISIHGATSLHGNSGCPATIQTYMPDKS